MRFAVRTIFVVSQLWFACVLGGEQPESSLRFLERPASETGLAFQHVSPMSAERHIHLTMGSGVAVSDFDRDGWPDLYFSQGNVWSGRLTSVSQTHDHLYRSRRGHFDDVSKSATVVSGGYGMGVAAGDFNNDGFPDVYAARFGIDQLLSNNGDGTFSKSSVVLPESTSRYSAGCTWTDVNADGAPDVFVTRYLDISESDYPLCVDKPTGLSIACQPFDMKGHSDVLLVSDGAGLLEDVSGAAGINAVHPAQGLGVITSDLDDDGDLDLYVANDSVLNHFWKNDGTGFFSEEGLISGLALNRNGLREAGMGLAAGDVTLNGRTDVVVTNFHEETNTLYRNEGFGFFVDVSDEIGVGAPSRSHLAFGVNLLDADADSDLDLFVANGHIHDRLAELGRDIKYRQSPQILKMDGGRYTDVSSRAGHVFSRPLLGRGSATLDYNRDGKLDLVMTSLGEAPVLIENQTKHHGNVLALRLSGKVSSRDAVGARVKASFAAGNVVFRFVDSSSSYLSTSEAVIRVGLGTATIVDQVEVRWPDGKTQAWERLSTEHEYCLVEGLARAFPVPARADR